MPFASRRRQRRRARRRSRAMMPLTRQVRAIVNASQETKHLFANGVNDTMWTTPAYVLIHDMPQGVNNAQRIGSKITQVALRVRGSIVNSSAVNGSNIRFLIFKDREAPIPATNPVAAPNFPVNIDRYIAYYDLQFYLPPAGAGPAPVRNFEYNHRAGHGRRGPEFQWDGGAAADLSTPGWSLLLFSSSAINEVFLQWSFELYYKDA